MTPRLVPWPRVALWAIAVSAAVVAILGGLVHDHAGTNRLDNAILQVINDVVPDRALRLALHLTDPPLVVGVLAATAVFALLLRRWNIAALAVIAPPIALLLTESVLKPVVHRSGEAESLAYPSGHETGIASLVCVLGLVLLASPVRRRRKVVLAAVLVAVVVAAAVALVGRYFHFATDTVGAVGVAVAVTLAVALVIDRVSAAIIARRRAPVRVPG
jgi:membrane-associated phospholipid phosphatase